MLVILDLLHNLNFSAFCRILAAKSSSNFTVTQGYAISLLQIFRSKFYKNHLKAGYARGPLKEAKAGEEIARLLVGCLAQ